MQSSVRGCPYCPADPKTAVILTWECPECGATAHGHVPKVQFERLALVASRCPACDLYVVLPGGAGGASWE